MDQLTTVSILSCCSSFLLLILSHASTSHPHRKNDLYPWTVHSNKMHKQCQCYMLYAGSVLDDGKHDDEDDDDDDDELVDCIHINWPVKIDHSNVQNTI